MVDAPSADHRFATWTSRLRMRRIRAGSIFSRGTDKASVAVPRRMMSGRPAALACATSVWMGLKMCAHSV